MTTFLNPKIQYNRLSARSLIQKLLDGMEEDDSDIFKTEQSNHKDIHILNQIQFLSSKFNNNKKLRQTTSLSKIYHYKCIITLLIMK